MNLVGLENTRKIRRCMFARSGAEAVRVLRKGLAATAAGDTGAINAYQDRDGVYRCEAMRFMATVESQSFNSLRSVAKWYAVWLKKIA